jgi:integrase
MERRWTARLLSGLNDTPRVVELVFHRDGEAIVDFRKAWATACQAAGVFGRLFHDLRRTAIRDMVRGGVPEKIAMEISGHRTRAVFDRYNIVSEDDKRQGMKRRHAYIAGRLSTSE